MDRRAILGRGRGNLAEYQPLGWLNPHTVLVLEDRDRPLQRIAVTRAGRDTARRTTTGYRILDVLRCETKFEAEHLRHDMLDAVDHWRLELAPSRVKEGHTQVWLACAERPSLLDLQLNRAKD